MPFAKNGSPLYLPDDDICHIDNAVLQNEGTWVVGQFEKLALSG
jgi:hypothetical protein